ncbi:MAG TPA: methylase, partial [Isosphaeraceae bacterium]
MAWSWTPDRHDAPELMDAPGLPEAEVADAYRVLRRVNRQFFGGLRSLGHEWARFLEEEPPGPGGVIVLDVGSGSGDLPRALRDRSVGLRLTALALDRDPTALALAARLG